MTSREKCPACGQSQRQPVANLPYDAPPLSDYLRTFYQAYPQCDFQSLTRARFHLAECLGCGCIFQDPVPDEAYLTEFYRRGLYGSAPAESAPFAPYQVEQNIRELMMIVRFLQPAVSHPRVLDFGTGEGRWAVLAAGIGLETHATDLSEHAFDRLTARGVICQRRDRLPTGHIDFINTEQVFEHLVNPSSLLCELKRCLRPGGIIKIGVPHDPDLRRKLRQPDWTAPKDSPASLNGVAPIEHLNHFEPASLRAMATSVGLEPLAVQGWNLVLPRSLPQHTTLRKRLGQWVQNRTGNFYHPYHLRTQTAFFRLPTQD